MQTYRVFLQEQFVFTVDVKANSQEEAEQKVAWGLQNSDKMPICDTDTTSGYELYGEAEEIDDDNGVDEDFEQEYNDYLAKEDN